MGLRVAAACRNAVNDAYASPMKRHSFSAQDLVELGHELALCGCPVVRLARLPSAAGIAANAAMTGSVRLQAASAS
jgi:hypothetical protein